ncbi:hypothetical protein BH24ACT14_BH24ACT14_02320 [soil metagenome]|jgi:catechol 2,3-dioxygenase-like lactoylglutathione lyase family enzyme
MESASQGPRHEIDRDIYGMPAFTSLQTNDLAASRRWWTEGLGFIELAVMPGPDGRESLIHLRRYRYQDVLLVGGRPAGTPAPVGISVSFAHAGPLDELAALAERLRQFPGGVVTGPEEMPWFAVQLTATDPDGYTIVLTAPSQRERPQEWSRMVRDSVVDPD